MMRSRVRAYAPNGASLGLVPTPQAWEASFVLGDVGAIRLDYPSDGPKSALLTSPCELAVEVSYDDGQTWTEPNDARYLRLREAADQVNRPQVVTYDGPSYVWRLTKAKVLPEGLLNADGKRPFLSATPGEIIRTLCEEAQTRGALEGIGIESFSGATDSNGVPWDQVITLYYDPGVDYLTILMNLQQQGMCEFTMAGRDLRLVMPGTTMDGDSGATLMRGRDLTEAPYRGTLEGLADYAYLLGDGGAYLERTNPEAEAPWGRWESFISQGGVSDTGTMMLLTDATLALSSGERVENTYGMTFAAAVHLPFRDYRLGQQVAVRATNGLPVSLRCRQITLTSDTNRVLSGNVILNDRFLESDVRQNRRITGITGGATAGGAGRPIETGPDRMAPAAPTGIALSSDAYLDDAGKVFAAITASWAAVTQNSDGTTISDLAGYEVAWRLYGDTAWTPGGAVDQGALSLTLGGFQPDTTYEVTVRAVDSNLNRSGYATPAAVVTDDDATAPSQPSVPGVHVYLGQLIITWDGHNSVGGTMPTDFSRMEVHVGTSPTFTPSSATFVDAITDRNGGSTVATGLTYGTTYYARLVAYDNSGNASPVSVAGSGVPAKAAAGDVDSITANQITAGAITSAITISGKFATALTGARVEFQNLGIKAYNSSGVLVVDVPSSGTGATFTGTLSTGFSGPRVVMDASLGYASVALYSGMVSETAPGGISTTVFGSGSGADAVLVIAAPQKNSLDRANIQLRSRDADTGADMLSYNYNGSVYWLSDATFGGHYYYDTSFTTQWLSITRGPSGGASIITPGTLTLRSTGLSTKIVGPLDHSGGDLLFSDSFGAKRLYGSQDGTGSYVQSENIWSRTAAGTANVVVNSAGTIFRSSSLAAHKVAIQRNWDGLEAVKGLNPTTFYDRMNAERYADLVDPDAENPGDDPEYPRLLLGLIAEDVEELGLEVLLARDDVGNLTGVNYDRIAVALIPWLQSLEARLATLEG